MTKVEELREVIEALNEQCEKDLPYQTGLMLDVDTLIAAAREEGAEQERERIRFYSEAIHNTHLGGTAVKHWIVPDNILDPVRTPKEKK